MQSVRVALRIRPLSTKERLNDCSECLITLPEEPTQVVLGQNRSFTFDHVFSTSAQQEEIYQNQISGLVDKFLEGYHVTVMAYGQTSSGKSYTMGTSLDGNLDIQPETHGIIPRAINTIFDKLSNEDPTSFQLSASFLELYNEELVDLFNPQGVKLADKRNGIQIREDPNGGIVIVGVQEEPCKTSKDVVQLLQKGLLCRSTGSTDMNLVSSRSHAIFTLILRQSKLVKQDSDPDGPRAVVNVISKLNFVDLAGSERLKRTNATGDRAKESISINSGLLALGNVISALGDESRKATHIPYRDSKLTRLLQDSLGGNSHTLMIACVSPSDSNFMETLNTLKYANRARNIKNRVTLNQDSGGNATIEIMQLRKQIANLKRELMIARGDNPTAIDNELGSNFEVSSGMKNQILTLETDNRQLNLTVIQQEQRIKTIIQELALVQSERDSLKVMTQNQFSMDTVKIPEELKKLVEPLSMSYAKELIDLKAKLVLLDSNSRQSSRNGSTRSLTRANRSKSWVETPVKSNSEEWQNTLQETLVEAKEEIQKNIQLLESQDQSTDMGSKTFSGSMLNFNEELNMVEQDPLENIQKDIALKEKLVQQLEVTKAEYENMKSNYEEKFKLLQDAVVETQKERDEAMKKKTGNEKEDKELAKKFEDKLKKMDQDLQDARRKHMDDLKNVKVKASNTEKLIESMKISINALKEEKAKLTTRIKEESQRAKTIEQSKESEIRQLKKKEFKANQMAKKLERNYEQQKGILKRRMEESVLFKNKLKSIVKSFRRKKLPSSNSNLSDSEISPKRPNRPSSSGMKRSRSEYQISGEGDSYLLPDVDNPQNQSRTFLKKEVFDREISDCVAAKQATSIVDELIKKREILVQERNTLQSEKEKLAVYLAEHADASDAEYKQMTDLEDRLEILGAEIKYLTNARIKSAQEEASELSTNLDPSFSYDNALTILKTLSVSEAEDMFESLINDLISLRVGEKARKLTEGSLHKTVMDLRHTLQLMRKAAVDSAIEHESNVNDLKHKYDNEIATWERRYTRLRSSYTEIKKKIPTSSQIGSTVGSMSNIAPPPADDDDTRGRKSHRTSNSSEDATTPTGTNLSNISTGNNGYKRSQSIPVTSEEASMKRRAVIPGAVNVQTSMSKAFSTDTLDSAGGSDSTGPFEMVKTLQGHSGAIYALAKTKDDKLCSASQDTSVKLWDVRTGDCVQTYGGHNGFVRALLCNDNHQIVSASQSIIRIWDQKSGKTVKQMGNYHKDDIECMISSSNGKYILSGGGDSSVCVWDVAKANAPIAMLTGHKGAVFDMLLVADDKFLITASRDHYIKVYNFQTFEFMTTLQPPHYDVVQCLSRIGDCLFSGSRDYSIKKWDISPLFGLNLEETSTSASSSKPSQVESDNNLSSPKTLVSSSLRSSLVQTVLSAHRDWIRTLMPHHHPVASPDSKNNLINANVLVSGARDGTAKIWNVSNNMEKIEEMKIHDASVNCMLSLPSSSSKGSLNSLPTVSEYFASGSSDRSIRIWRNNPKYPNVGV